ncbi:MAG TPA: hypothetical protein VN081_01435 [Dongiaceae bacterium]|nr:hypothetical protein [Dongiaceae bacterium]
MSRLPVVGGDDGDWGTVLNDFLTVSHNSDGTFKDGSVSGNVIAPSSVAESQLSSSVQTKLNATSGSGTVDLTLASTASDMTLSGAAQDVIFSSASSGSAGVMASADKAKLDGIAAGATANDTDANLENRANHTGTQTASTISDFSPAVDSEVANLLVPGSGITLTYSTSPTNSLTVAGKPIAYPDRVLIDDYAGASWDAQFTAALSDVSSMTNIKAIQLGSANPTSTTGGRTPFSGMRIYGMSGRGPKDPELASGQYIPHYILYKGGSGLTSMFNGNGLTLYNVFIDDLSIQYGTGSAFWYQNTGTLYACEFRSLTHYGPRNVIGHETDSAKLTQVLFTGHWNIQGITNVPFHIGGSDNNFWVDGYCNLNGSPTTAGNGAFLFHADYLQKTNIHNMYITCINGWRGVWVSGSSTAANGLYFQGIRIEGMNTSTPNPGRAALLDNGTTVWRDLWLAYSMTAPSPGENGVVEITGGSHTFSGATWDRGTLPATATSAPYNSTGAVPLFYVSGGTLTVSGVHTPTGEIPYAVQTGTGKIVVTDGSLVVQDASGNPVNANPWSTTVEYLKVLSADQVYTSNTTPASITDLSIPVAAGETWIVDGEIFYTGDTAGDVRFAWSVPASTTQRWGSLGLATAATGAQSSGVFNTTTGTASAMQAGAVSAIDMGASLRGTFTFTNSGTMTLQAAQGTSSTNATTVYAKSFVRFTRM